MPGCLVQMFSGAPSGLIFAMRCGVLLKKEVMLADGHDPDSWDILKAGMIAALDVSQLSGSCASASISRSRDSGCLVGDCRGRQMEHLSPW